MNTPWLQIGDKKHSNGTLKGKKVMSICDVGYSMTFVQHLSSTRLFSACWYQTLMIPVANCSPAGSCMPIVFQKDGSNLVGTWNGPRNIQWDWWTKSSIWEIQVIPNHCLSGMHDEFTIFLFASKSKTRKPTSWAKTTLKWWVSRDILPEQNHCMALSAANIKWLYFT